jgi:CheY-like chemotaxis protein
VGEGLRVEVEGISKLLDALAKLLGVLIWPATICYILVRFKTSIGDFISSIGEATFKGAGFEASIKKRQNEVAGALAGALAATSAAGSEHSGEDGTPHDAASAARDAVQIASGVDARTIRQVEGSRVLWVDDRPDNNNYERQSLEAIGVKFTISTSTEDAMKKLGTQKFNAIISDMGRPPDPRAGYTLLESLRASGDRTPFIIYAGSRSPEHQEEARRRGAVGCTNRATELFEMVLSILQPA